MKFITFCRWRHWKLLAVVIFFMDTEINACELKPKVKISEKTAYSICENTRQFAATDKIQAPVENAVKKPHDGQCVQFLWNQCGTTNERNNCLKFERNYCKSVGQSEILIRSRRSKNAGGPLTAKFKIPACWRFRQIPKNDESRKTLLSRIIGGLGANPHEFPYQVRMRSQSGKTLCGGTILNKNYIITAAHCFEPGASPVLPWLGSHDSMKPENDEQHPGIRRVILHQHYDNITLVNDIALIELSTPLRFNDKVQPALLPPDDWEPVGYAIVTGWGRLSENGSGPAILQQVTLPVVENERCQRALNYPISNTQICAGFLNGTKKDACAGDSGGPMVEKLPDGSFVLIGIVSYGFGCARPGLPGVYTRVAKFKDWIATNAL